MAEKKKATKKVADAKKTEEKVFDIASPGKTVASASGKPVIVTNRAVVRDPMVTPQASAEAPAEGETSVEGEVAEAEQQDKAMPVSKLRIEPLHTDVKAETGALVGGSTKPEDTPQPEEAQVSDQLTAAEKDKSKETDDDEPTDEEFDELNASGKKAADKAAAAEAAAEQKRREEAEAAIASKQYFVPINAVKKRRSARLLIVVLVAVIGLAALFTFGPGKELLSGFGLGSSLDTQAQTAPAAAKKSATKKSTDASDDKSEQAGPKTIAYTELQTIQSTDGSVAVKVPKEYSEYQKSETVLQYGQRKPNSTKDSYSSIGISIESAPNRAAVQQAKTRVMTQLKQKGQAYDDIVASLKRDGFDAKLGDFTEYKSGAIADILPSKDVLGNEAQGKVLMLFGATKVYSVILAADSAVWMANQAVFEQMIESIVVQ